VSTAGPAAPSVQPVVLAPFAFAAWTASRSEPLRSPAASAAYRRYVSTKWSRWTASSAASGIRSATAAERRPLIRPSSAAE
jgi:hypothetical protein